MKKLIRLLALVLALIMSLTVFAACKKTPDKNDVELDDKGNIRPTDTVANVEFWINGDEYELEVFQDLVDRFNKKHEGQIKVKLVQKPSDGYETAVQQSLSGEKLDVFYVGDV